METQGLLEPVEWFLDHILVEKGASKHTIEAYRNDLTNASQFFANAGIEGWHELHQQLISSYEANLAKNLARSSAQRRMSALRSLLKFLKRNGEGPTTQLPEGISIKKEKRLPKALSYEQIEKMMAVFDTSSVASFRDRVLLELLYGTGMRISEAVGLELQNIDLEEALVRVEGKRNKVRLIPLPDGTVEWLTRYLSDARPKLHRINGALATSLLLLTDRGKPMLRQNAFKTVQEAAVRAGLQKLPSPHTIRHTYAVHLLRGGADLRAVQELLGHESLETTQIYTQLQIDEIRAHYVTAHPRK